MSTSENAHQPDLKLAAVCGLFCPSCMIYIATRVSPEKRALIARSLGKVEEDLHCDGCRAEHRYSYCASCQFVACASEKGVDFCGACDEYPCDKLKEFQAERPHRLELWEDQDRIREVGYEQWYAEMVDRYACPQCGTLNSAYHPACRACGTKPSCAYVAAHQTEIADYFARRAQRRATE